jgi:hypothetical protein
MEHFTLTAAYLCVVVHSEVSKGANRAVLNVQTCAAAGFYDVKDLCDGSIGGSLLSIQLVTGHKVGDRSTARVLHPLIRAVADQRSGHDAMPTQ